MLLVPVVAALGFFGFVAPANAQYTNVNNPYTQPNDPGQSDSIGVIGAGENKQDALINVVKGFINWVLGILALIALIVLLRGGFQMVTAAGNEEQYKKGFTILKQAAIGLIIIGIAWFIISIIFRLVNITTSDAQSANSNS